MHTFRKHKYNAKKCVIDGYKFDSKAEGLYYEHLKSYHPRVRIIEFQPKVYLTKARILYKPDFLIEAGSTRTYVDVKGMATPVFNIKKRLWKHYATDPLDIVVKKGKKFYMQETVYPNGWKSKEER